MADQALEAAIAAVMQQIIKKTSVAETPPFRAGRSAGNGAVGWHRAQAPTAGLAGRDACGGAVRRTGEIRGAGPGETGRPSTASATVWETPARGAAILRNPRSAAPPLCSETLRSCAGVSPGNPCPSGRGVVNNVNVRWPGDYALFAQASCTEDDTVVRFEWYYKPSASGTSGEMAMLAERPPGYARPDGG